MDFFDTTLIGVVSYVLKHHCEYCFFIRHGMDFQASAMEAHDLAAQAQADPVAVCMGGEERNENLINNLRLNPRAIVFHRNFNLILLISDGGQLNSPVLTFTEGFGRVFNQIVQHLRNQVFVGHDGWQSWKAATRNPVEALRYE